jgi:hypothetical protein
MWTLGRRPVVLWLQLIASALNPLQNPVLLLFFLEETLEAEAHRKTQYTRATRDKKAGATD